MSGFNPLPYVNFVPILQIHIGNEEYIHVRIYEDFDGFFELDGLQSGKHYEDEIDYFEQ